MRLFLSLRGLHANMLTCGLQAPYVVPGIVHAVPALDKAHLGALVTEALLLGRATHICNQLESWQADWAVLQTAERQGQLTSAEVLSVAWLLTSCTSFWFLNCARTVSGCIAANFNICHSW
jgi:hypothetical protein